MCLASLARTARNNVPDFYGPYLEVQVEEVVVAVVVVVVVVLVGGGGVGVGGGVLLLLPHSLLLP